MRPIEYKDIRSDLMSIDNEIDTLRTWVDEEQNEGSAEEYDHELEDLLTALAHASDNLARYLNNAIDSLES